MCPWIYRQVFPEKLNSLVAMLMHFFNISQMWLMIGIVACFLIWQSKNIFTWNNKIASLGNYIADYTALAHANEANKARLNH